MVSYESADATTMEVIDGILQKHHKELADAKVKLDAQFWKGEDEEPAIKVQGYPTFGKVIVFAADKRKGGSKDMRICLDFSDWDGATTDDREAMVDHLLQQIEVRMTAGSDTKASEIIYDSANRPKLKRRKFDLRLAGYSVIAERHGYHSPEYRTVQAMKMQWNQLLLFQGVNGGGAANTGASEPLSTAIIERDRLSRKGRKKGEPAAAQA